ncbi:MAG: DUF5615 family PIN-like protein [Cyanobacteria bacterium J06649_4]
MDFLIDEDTQSKILVKTLKSAGHDVLTVQDIGMNGASDKEVLDYAHSTNRTVLTKNCEDFRALHKNRGQSHYGIFAVYQGKASEKQMTRQSIMNALSNLCLAKIELKDRFIELNHWVY